jgi:hypothetical protein
MPFYAILHVRTGDVAEVCRDAPQSRPADFVAIELPARYEAVRLWLQRRGVAAVDRLLADIEPTPAQAPREEDIDYPENLYVYGASAFTVRLTEEIHRQRRYGHPFTLVTIETDRDSVSADDRTRLLAVIRNAVRLSDIIGIVAKTQIVVLLVDQSATRNRITHRLLAALQQEPGHPRATVLLFPEDERHILALHARGLRARRSA